MIRSLGITLAFLLIYVLINPALQDKYSTKDDAHFYLLPYCDVEDPIVDIAKNSAPLGYQALMNAITRWERPIRATRYIQVLAFLIYIFFAVEMGVRLSGIPGGLISGALAFCSSWNIGLIAGGLPHSFAPGMFMWILSSLHDRTRNSCAAIFGALFVPQGMVVAGLLSLMLWPREAWKDLRLYLALAIALTTALVCPVTRTPNIDTFESLPELHEGGRSNLWRLDEVGSVVGRSLTAPLSSNRNSFKVLVDERKEKGGLVMRFLRWWEGRIAWEDKRGGIAGFWFLVVPLVLLPLNVYAMMVAMLIGYTISSWCAYSLYVPARFWIYGASCISTMGWVLVMTNLKDTESHVFKRFGLKVLLGALVTFWVIGGPGVRPNEGFNWNLWKEQEKLYDFVWTTDPEAMWAGPPRDPAVIGLSLYTGRKAWVTWETAVPWRRDVYEKVVEPRMLTLIDLYWKGVRTPQIQYLIIPKEEKHPWAYNPFVIPEEGVTWLGSVYEDEHYRVVKL